MEFNFLSKYGQSSTNATQPARFTCFTQQTMPAGHSNNELFRNPNEMREAIQRELEKERIRKEIIAQEIARRYELEAEVRREMMMEKEMALRRSDGFMFVSRQFEPQAPIRLPILHQQEGRSFEEQTVVSLDERLGQSLRRDIGEFPERKIVGIKPVPEVDKDKVFTLGKPNTNVTGVKRKAVTPPAAVTSELKEEWSCAICQIKATSEQALNEHLVGKRHKSKEAAITAQKTGQNFGFGILPKKTPVPIKLVETISKPSSVQILLKKKHFKQQRNVLKKAGKRR